MSYYGDQGNFFPGGGQTNRGGGRANRGGGWTNRGRGRTNQGGRWTNQGDRPLNPKRFDNKGKHIPGSDVDVSTIFDYAYLKMPQTINYLSEHGRILLFVRGPPGTARYNLCLYIQSIYPHSFLLSAKQYKTISFANTQNYQSNYKEEMEKSHNWCLDKLEVKMRENHPFIILSNTHVSRWEIEQYLNVIKTFCYTVIMVETPRKFQIKSQVLALTNCQNLDENYFAHRLRNWCNYFPWHIGWFLNPEDSDFLIKKGFQFFNVLLRDTTFNLDLGLRTRVAQNFFNKENEIFCICSFCKYDEITRRSNPYTKNEVQEVLGKAYPLEVFAYIINPDHILALVNLNPEQTSLISLAPEFNLNQNLEAFSYKYTISDPKTEAEVGDLCEQFEGVHLDTDKEEDPSSNSSLETIKNDLAEDAEEISDNNQAIVIKEEKEACGPASSHSLDKKEVDKSEVSEPTTSHTLDKKEIEEDEISGLSTSHSFVNEDINEQFLFENPSIAKQIETSSFLKPGQFFDEELNSQKGYYEETEESMSLNLVPSVSGYTMGGYRNPALSSTDSISEMSNRLQEVNRDSSNERIVSFVDLFEDDSFPIKSTSTLKREHNSFDPKWFLEKPQNTGIIVLASNNESCGFVPHFKDPQKYIKYLFNKVIQDGYQEIEFKAIKCPEAKFYQMNSNLEYIIFPKDKTNFQSVFTGLY